jgi:hypothetical protein
MSESEEETTNTLEDDLAAAWDASEGDNDGGIQQSTVSQSDGESDGIEEHAPSELSVDAKQSDDIAEPVQSGDGTDIEKSGLNEVPVDDLSIAPKGLSLEAREEWKNVPDAVKKEISKREKDFNDGIVRYSGQAKRADQMDKTLAPYQQYLQMNGGPGKAMQSLLNTGSGLQMGSPMQKAQIVSNLIQQFGIDIKTLDNMLVGEQPTEQQQQGQQFNQMLDQRLQPLQQQLAQYQQRDQQVAQQAQGQVANEVQTFQANPANEFYNDVRGQMADLLDMAANRGQAMTMDEAYKTACLTHPQISQIVQNRTNQAQVDQKRQAASSISGTRGGGGGSNPSTSTAQALNDAWDAQGVGGGRV